MAPFHLPRNRSLALQPNYHQHHARHMAHASVGRNAGEGARISTSTNVKKHHVTMTDIPSSLVKVCTARHNDPNNVVSLAPAFAPGAAVPQATIQPTFRGMYLFLRFSTRTSSSSVLLNQLYSGIHEPEHFMICHASTLLPSWQMLVHCRYRGLPPGLKRCRINMTKRNGNTKTWRPS